ncbi:unnamed protein product [Coregonus sp. 'balchen']|nr:unnamed protein product [Coregonus sp. 'balchen']
MVPVSIRSAVELSSPVPTLGGINKKARSRPMDKDGRYRNRLSHTSAPMYLSKAKRPAPGGDLGGVGGATNRLPGGQQTLPLPRRQRRDNTHSSSTEEAGPRSSPSLIDLHILETDQQMSSHNCPHPDSCSYSVSLQGTRNSSTSRITLHMTSSASVWVRQCGATRGRLCPDHTETELYAGERTVTKVHLLTTGTDHLWSVPVLSFQDVTYHFRVAQSRKVRCGVEEGNVSAPTTPPYSDYYFLIQSSCE